MGTIIVVEQRVDADPASVFSAWTDADALARWWWPHIPDTTYEVDGRAGGRYEIRSVAAGIGVQGEFTVVDPPRELHLTWHWMDDGVVADEEPVRVTFAPADRGTVVTVRHELARAGDGDDIAQGWRDVLSRLARSVHSG